MWAGVWGGGATGPCQGNEFQIGTDLHMGKSREKRHDAGANILGEEIKEDGKREAKIWTLACTLSPTTRYEFRIKIHQVHGLILG
jgi:hypothetical protein